MSPKDRPLRRSSLERTTSERLEAIVEAAERAATQVIDDAEAEGRRHLAEARADADRLVSERLSSLSHLTDTLVAQAESIRSQSEALLESLELARSELEPDRPAPAPRAVHLSAVVPVAEPRHEAAEDEEPAAAGSGAERGSPAGARLLATQMAVSGSSREEIAQRLRDGFEIDDTEAILDAILGPED